MYNCTCRPCSVAAKLLPLTQHGRSVLQRLVAHRNHPGFSLCFNTRRVFLIPADIARGFADLRFLPERLTYLLTYLRRISPSVLRRAPAALCTDERGGGGGGAQNKHGHSPVEEEEKKKSGAPRRVFPLGTRHEGGNWFQMKQEVGRGDKERAV